MSLRLSLAGLVCFALLATAAAQTVAVTEAHGKVQKADKDSITFQPREAGGKFGKDITLKITGTSRISMLAPQTRDKKEVMTQRDTDAKDVAAGQSVSVIYATSKDKEHVLLSAVIHPPEK